MRMRSRRRGCWLRHRSTHKLPRHSLRASYQCQVFKGTRHLSCPLFLTHFAVLYYFVACFDGCTISCKNQCFLGCCRFEGWWSFIIAEHWVYTSSLKSIESFEPCACSFIFVLCRKVNKLSLCFSRIDSSYRHRRWDKPVEHQIHSSPEFRNILHSATIKPRPFLVPFSGAAG